MAQERLDKIISDSGAATRSEAKRLLKGGAVRVDGAVQTDGAIRLDAAQHVIICAGKRLDTRPFRSFMLYKPEGVLSATEDREQKTVIDLLPQELKGLGLFPVGRLDKDTTGLLILTNDGELSHRITSPRHEISKCYELCANGELDEADVAALAAGIVLRDGTRCLPAKLKPNPQDRSQASIYITEGKYHQVKRMLAALGKPVLSLKRSAIGGLKLDENLRPGELKELSDDEIALMFTN